MPAGPDGKTIIIVKKVSGHGGHHGGSWKVAYADFVTSMMAFFMVLWLVNSASVQTRERIASYFRAPGLFEKGSGTPVEMGGAGILPDAFAPPAESNSQVQPDKNIYTVGTKDGEQRESFGSGGGDGMSERGETKGALAPEGAATDAEKAAETKEFKKIAEEIKGMIEKDAQAIAGLLGKIDVKIDQRGLHLEIMDTPYASMFSRGSAVMVPAAEQELMKIAQIVQRLPNPVDIEGHTDAMPYRGKIADRYDNWNLSSDRANQARQVFKRAGMQDQQVARVVGYAAQRPKNTTDPKDASNRRISISMRYTEQAADSLRGTQVKETRTVPLKTPLQSNQAAPKNADAKATMNEAVTAKGAQPKPGLAVEVKIDSDEIEPKLPPPVLDEGEIPARPLSMEKDKIFGDSNPFFGK